MIARFFFALLMLAVSPVGLSAATVQAMVTSVTGNVTYASPGSNSFSPLKQGAKLDMNSTIVTGSDGVALVVPVPGTAIRIANNSRVVLDSNDFSSSGRSAKVDLKSGTLSALIDPKVQPHTNFQIQTPQGIAAARGTFYGVTVDAGKTYVAVKHGDVGVVKAKESKDKA